ncbi:MAG: FeoB-associated Cys-rich membrane protein [Oscillospiraceae bacterium]
MIVILCGLVIALALYLLVRSLRKMSQGQCCEGCSGCSHKNNCSSYRPDDVTTKKGSG